MNDKIKLLNNFALLHMTNLHMVLPLSIHFLTFPKGTFLSVFQMQDTLTLTQIISKNLGMLNLLLLSLRGQTKSINVQLIFCTPMLTQLLTKKHYISLNFHQVISSLLSFEVFMVSKAPLPRFFH